MPVPVLVERILWFLPAFVQVAISVFMVRRKLHRELPWFFSYTILQASQATLAWFIRHEMPHYFYFYWGIEFVSAIVELGVIYEIFRNVVLRYEGIQRVGFTMYRWFAVALLVIATMMAANGPDLNIAAMQGIVTLERGLRIIQVGLLVFLFIFASYLGLSWRNRLFGVGLGFGFFASVELALAAVSTELGITGSHLYALLKPIAYNCTVLIWAVYVFQREPVAKPITSIPETEMALWDQTLSELVRR
jgi:hypothetical protein